MEKLTHEQQDILKECITKKNGGLSLAMGKGKTFLGLALGKVFCTGNGKCIVVVSKNLVSNWVNELTKFFGDTLPFVVVHQDTIKNIGDFLYTSILPAKIVILTPEVLVKFYKKYHIESRFIRVEVTGGFPQIRTNFYDIVERPLLSETDDTFGSALYSQEWGSVIVDEGQNHTNIKVSKCRAICSLFTQHRWIMSGTMFNEPKPERILGYFCMIGDVNFPRSLPLVEKFIKGNNAKGPLVEKVISTFKGISPSLVHRESTLIKNNNGVVIKCNNIIISHKMTEDEENVYMSMNQILNIIRQNMKIYKNKGDKENTRKYSTYLLAMITYLRQCIVCPVLVFAKCALDMVDMKNKSELSTIIFNELQKLNVNGYLDNPNSVKSSRLVKILEQIDKNPTNNIIIFSSFRTSIDILLEYLPKNRSVSTITGGQSIHRRQSIIESFKTKRELGNILLLTYDIGAEGLNLQESNNVMLMDMNWSDGKSKQAIARVFRNGQQSSSINVYVFTSNTGIEKAILSKQDEKLVLLDELQHGQMKSRVSRMSVNDLIKIIDMDDCLNSLSTKFKSN